MFHAAQRGDDNVLGFRMVPRVELLWLTDLFVNLPVLCTFVHLILLDPQPVLSACRIGHVLSITYLIRRCRSPLPLPP